MTHELLRKHKPSAEWYTPPHIWERVNSTFSTAYYPNFYDRDICYDPCPRNSKEHKKGNGLLEDWTKHKFIYCNPPTPAAPWAKKAIQTVTYSPETIIIFAAFSEAVLWQVNELLDYPICWVRNRINWIDGNEIIKVNIDKISVITDEVEIDGKWYKPNPGYLEPSKSPRNYNAFVLISASNDGTLEYYDIERRFCKQFADLGTIQLSRTVYKP